MIETPHWLWVTTREIADISIPDLKGTLGWTCDKETKKGELSLLYCNSKGRAIKGIQKSAICYLMQATSDAEEIIGDPNWEGHRCDCRVLYRFRNPVRFGDLKQRHSEFKEWRAYGTMNFQGRSFEIPEKIWKLLDDMAMEKDPDYGGYQKYIELTPPNIESISDADLEAIDAEERISEGGRDRRPANFYEHNKKLRSKATEIHGTKCKACGFDFNKRYGKYGYGFIEVHHLIPASSHKEETLVDPRTEMTVVCSNCHRMIHRKRDKVLPLDELKEIISE